MELFNIEPFDEYWEGGEGNNLDEIKENKK